MRSSFKNIRHAYEVMSDFEESTKGLKKYAIIKDLKRYGVDLSGSNELGVRQVLDIYKIVLERIVDRYTKDGKVK